MYSLQHSGSLLGSQLPQRDSSSASATHSATIYLGATSTPMLKKARSACALAYAPLLPQVQFKTHVVGLSVSRGVGL